MKFTNNSLKICKFINDNNIDITNNYFNNISNHIFIKKVFELIKNTNKEHNFDIIQDITLKPLHKDNEYPVYFLLFFNLKKYSNVYDIDKINNFKDFCKWYEDNINKISFNKIKQIIVESKDNDLLDLYNCLFKPIENRKQLHKIIYDNMFLPLDVQQHCESSIINYQKIKFLDCDINLYKVKDDDFNIDFFMHIVAFMIQLAKTYNISPINPEINIFLGNQKKKFSNNQLIKGNILKLTPENINSGSSISGIFVNVWRKEEVYKVLIHELIHYFGFDYHVFDEFNKLENHFKQNYCIEGYNKINEAYTEFLAVIIHVAFVSEHLKLDFDNLLEFELKFSLFQISKIMKYFNFSSCKELVKIDKCENKFNQSTSVFSYFCIKTALLMNATAILDFIVNNNIVITKTHEKEFTDLVISSTENQKFNNFVDFFINFNFPKHHEESNFIFDTLRMTGLEIH